MYIYSDCIPLTQVAVISLESDWTDVCPVCYYNTGNKAKYYKLCYDTFGAAAAVVFEPTLLYDTKYDNGDYTIQTSRRGEIFKFWFMWKVKVSHF